MSKEVKRLENSAWKLFSRYIRLRDCRATTGRADFGKCITCGEKFPFKELQAGHFIGGRHKNNLFLETGVHAQCRGCNYSQSHGGSQQLVYRRKIVEKYGEGYDEVLEENDKVVKKFSASDLEELIEQLKGKIKKLERS